MSIACGGSAATSALYCWGAACALPASGARPDDSPAAALPLPTRVPKFWSGRRIVSLAAGWAHSLFVDSGGLAWAVGDGAFGQLGCGQGVQQLMQPMQITAAVAEGRRVVQAAAGMRHSLLLVQHPQHGPQLLAFGANSKAQCGSGQAERTMWQPTEVPGLQHVDVAAVIAGGDHSGVISGDGELWLWGRPLAPAAQAPHAGCRASAAAQQPQRLQLLDASDPAAAPGDAAAALPVARVAQACFGWHHLLVLDGCGRVWAAGSNRWGQCGICPAAPDSAVTGPATAAHVAADVSQCGSLLAAARNLAGTVPATATRVAEDEAQWVPRPQQVPGLQRQRIMSIAAGSEHSAAVTTAGVVYTWGWGEHGQLGMGNCCNAWQPQVVDFRGLGGKVAALARVACGSGFTVASA